MQLSADQSYRANDLAIGSCEDVHPLNKEAISNVVQTFQFRGATVKLSSIHINGWIGPFNKLEMSLSLLQEKLAVPSKKEKSSVVYVGDPPNNQPMFEYFPFSVGVANIAPYLDEITAKP